MTLEFLESKLADEDDETEAQRLENKHSEVDSDLIINLMLQLGQEKYLMPVSKAWVLSRFLSPEIIM